MLQVEGVYPQQLVMCCAS